MCHDYTSDSTENYTWEKRKKNSLSFPEDAVGVTSTYQTAYLSGKLSYLNLPDKYEFKFIINR